MVLKPYKKYQPTGHEALIIVDPQNDFMPGGALAVADDGDFIPYINELIHINKFDQIIASMDWHPQDHLSFDINGGEWPVHCVQNTFGASLHSGLEVEAIHKVVLKGQHADHEAYSAFDAGASLDLKWYLKDRGIYRIFIVGKATDYCVKSTAIDATDAGFETTVLLGGCRGVSEETTEQAIKDMLASGIAIRM